MTDHLVISAIRDKRASLEGELRQAERRVEHLRANVATLDGALSIFDPSGEPHVVKSKAPRREAPGVRHGHFSRDVLDTLRRAEAAMTARDIATKIAVSRGIDVSTSSAMQAYIGRVRSALDRKREGLVSEKRGDAVFWQVAR